MGPARTDEPFGGGPSSSEVSEPEVLLTSRHRRAEESIRPLLSERTRVAEDDGHLRVADLHRPEEVGHEAARDVLELEERCVAILDDHRRTVHDGELGEREGEAAVDEALGEIQERLSLDDGDPLAVVQDAVVATGKRLALVVTPGRLNL